MKDWVIDKYIIMNEQTMKANRCLSKMAHSFINIGQSLKMVLHDSICIIFPISFALLTCVGLVI